MDPNRSFSLDEICTLVDLPRRTVRYYIQIGLVDRPDGETRAARYSARHLERLLAIRRWQSAGYSLDRIAEIVSTGNPGEPVPPRPRPPGSVEVWSHLVVADGVEVRIEPGRAGLAPEQVRGFFARVLREFESIKNGEHHEK